MSLKDLKQDWHQKISKYPVLIAGPCSAESEKQVLETALKLDKEKVNIYRAGIWKPRTRPGNFEGVGKIGLGWLKKVKKETGFLVSTEVANRQHVDLALEADIDILWLGARTTVNPFLVQEVANALKDTDKIILIKNPVNPDIELWIGAMERLYDCGVKKLGLIHRGFSVYKKDIYRNKPKWQIPISLKSKFPNIPIICDPSHICGSRDTLYDVAQSSFDLGFDGLMIESHINPDKAWSDAKQQVTPAQLEKIISKIKLRKETFEDVPFNEKLRRLRKAIDVIDEHLIFTIKERMEKVEDIANLKKAEDVTILQSDRWNEILKNALEQGKKNNLSENLIKNIFKSIHQESINYQGEIMNRK